MNYEKKFQLFTKSTAHVLILVSRSLFLFTRLTSILNLTGSHKERFDADGKGKGLEGNVASIPNTESLVLCHQIHKTPVWKLKSAKAFIFLLIFYSQMPPIQAAAPTGRGAIE